MAAMIGALGSDGARVLDAFVSAMERDYGRGEIALIAVAQLGLASKP
jgi:hypothetical protein